MTCGISDRRAFTLIEILTVIVVIAVLIAIAAPSFLGQADKAEDSAAQQNLATVAHAAKASATERHGRYLTDDFGVWNLVDAVQASEPQLSVGHAVAADTSELAALPLHAGRVYVITDTFDAAGDQPELRLASASPSGQLCTMTAPAAGATVTDCATSTHTSDAQPENYPDVVAASAPKAWWRLGDTDSTAADRRDVAAGSYDGPKQGAAGAVRDSDTAATFDGVDDIVTVPHGPLGAPASVSVEAWVKPAAKKTNFIFTDARRDLGDDGVALMLRAKGDAQFYAGNTTDAAADRVIHGGNVTLGQWHHIVGSYDQPTGQMRLYVDGMLVAAKTSSVPITWHDSRQAIIARKSKATGQELTYFHGDIDEVAFYDRALTPVEVERHFRAGDGLPPA